MEFRTKLDFSTRQVKQKTKVMADLSGSTKFGVPFSAITTGPDLSKSGVTAYYMSFNSTFSGNSATTVYNWAYPIMSSGEYQLSALTPSNSADTQIVLSFSSTSSTIIDGNFVNLTYSGITFDITPVFFNDLGSGNYSGTVYSELLEILSAEPLDFTGRTIWVDVSGITRTNRLIVTENPQIGDVLTCSTSEGMAEWLPLSSITGLTSLWTAGTGSPSAVLYNTGGIANSNFSLSYGSATTASNIGSVASGAGSISSGYFSTAIGGVTNATGTYCYAEGAQTTASTQTSHAEGFQTLASGISSHAQGQNTRSTGAVSHSEGAFTLASATGTHAEGYATSATTSYSHSEGYETLASGNVSHAEGFQTSATASYSHSEGFQTLASGTVSHAEGLTTEARGAASHAQGVGTIAGGTASLAMGFQCITSGDTSFAGGDQCVASGQTNFVFGDQSSATGYMIVVLGGGINGTQDNTTYVDQLNILTIGAGPGFFDLGLDVTGNVVDQASDIKLKENINTIESALEKVLKLRGVTYNWIDRQKGGDVIKLGFIAQEVNSVIPELTYKNGEYMGVHYKDITALLVEAIKELYETKSVINNANIETETIVAEDNNIELNYNGDHSSSIGGGLTVLNGISDGENTELKTDQNGNWLTNVDLIPKGLIIPNYTPESSSSEGKIGSITYDENYIYIKTKNGWKRTSLESF